MQRDTQLVSSGFASLDKILGGGLLKGKIVEYYGDEEARKDIISLGTGIYGDRPIIYFDIGDSYSNNAEHYIPLSSQIYLISGARPANEYEWILRQIAPRAVTCIIMDSITLLGLHRIQRLVPILSILAKKIQVPILLNSHCEVLRHPLGYFTIVKYAAQRVEMRIKDQHEDGSFTTLMKCTKSPLIPLERTASLTLHWEEYRTDYLGENKHDHKDIYRKANITMPIVTTGA